MSRAARQDEWNIQTNVNTTHVRDMLGHPVYILGVPVLLVEVIQVRALGIVEEFTFLPGREGLLHAENSERSLFR